MKVRTSCPFLLFIYSFMNLVNGLNNTVFHPTKLEKLVMGSERVVSVWLCNNINMSQMDVKLTFTSISLVVDNPKIAYVSGDPIKTIKKLDGKYSCSVNFTIKGNLLGRTSARLVKSKSNPRFVEKRNSDQIQGTSNSDGNEDGDDDDDDDAILPIVVIKQNSFLSKVFVSSVAILVSLSYINMGCSLDIEVVKSVIKKPIAPGVGLICQYICMPLVSIFYFPIFHMIIWYDND